MKGRIEPEKYDLKTISETYLDGFPEDCRRVIVQEAQRLQERLSSIPWYADRARKSGGTSWLHYAISYSEEG